jgi:GT2 family glycosyltransferase
LQAATRGVGPAGRRSQPTAGELRLLVREARTLPWLPNAARVGGASGPRANSGGFGTNFFVTCASEGAESVWGGASADRLGARPAWVRRLAWGFHLASHFDTFVVTLFLSCSLLLAVYGLHLYMLVFLFRRRLRRRVELQRQTIARYRRETADRDWPVVTSQLPIFNEADVAVRVMNAVAALEYPQGKHEIQVLDDSTDETRWLVDHAVRRLQRQGVDVKVIRRDSRAGFKAGALAAGLRQCRGEYAAVFDADFIPPRDFLRRAIALIASDEGVACVQGRWAHLNAEESWLTRAQSLGIDGHFAIEQGARAWNGLLMNFNGTAGVWRIAAIHDPAVGGWQGDTLTEDLDLSYRAQLAGWKMTYCLELACPAELPGHVNALKSQQRRWAKGSMQTAVKLLPTIWRAPLRFAQKLEATLHLTHYSIAIWMVILAVLARPMVAMIDPTAHWRWMAFGWGVICASAVAPSLCYGYARYSLGGGFGGLRIIPYLMVLGTGLCVNNMLAVFQGLLQRGGVFERTPKSGSTGRERSESRYKPLHHRLWIVEMLLGAYCLAYWAIYLSAGRYAFSFFLLIYAAGFLSVGWMSRPSPSAFWRRRRRVRRPRLAAGLAPSLSGAGAAAAVQGARR